MAALVVLIWAGSPATGASLNPARSLAPALLIGDLSSLWIYLIGPPLGACAAVALFAAATRGRETLTAKLFHDPRYRSTMRTALPAMPARPGA